jgi:hypothetical protein
VVEQRNGGFIVLATFKYFIILEKSNYERLDVYFGM